MQKSEITFGIILALSSLGWLLLEYILGFHTSRIAQHALFTNLFVLPTAILLLWAMYIRKKLLGGQMSYRQAFSCGMMVSIVGAIFSPVAILLYTQSINPGFFPAFIRYTVNRGMMKQAQAEAYFSLKSYLLQGAAGTIVSGAVLSALGALVLKSTKK